MLNQTEVPRYPVNYGLTNPVPRGTITSKSFILAVW